MPLTTGHNLKGDCRIILRREHTSPNIDQDVCQGQTGKNILTKITRNQIFSSKSPKMSLVGGQG